MDVWERSEADRPSVFSGFNFAAALVLHVVFFGGIWALNGFSISKPEKIVPIELTIVVNENLDGVENEPPPLDDPPPPPQPKPKPQKVEKKKEEPKNLEKIVTNIVQKAEKKVEPKKVEPKKEEPKKEEPPKKTTKELREDRIRRMRESVADSKKVKIKVENQPSGNGRTEKQTMSADEIKKKLGGGYKPGTKTQLAGSEEQRCISLIQREFYEKWDQVGGPQTWRDNLEKPVLTVKFGPGGRVTGYSLIVSSGDKKVDNTVIKAANLVKAIGGLSDEFIARNKDGVSVRFTVKKQ